LTVSQIQQGSIPEAMQWKKIAILTPAAGETNDLLSYLRDLDEKEIAPDSIVSPPGDILLGDFSHIYFLLGWSGIGTDERRSATMDSAVFQGSEIRLYVSRPELVFEGSVMGTADMKFVGWDVDVWQLTAGEYSVRLLIKRDRIRIQAQPYARVVEADGKYQLKKVLRFNVMKPQ
jgi:hypothetical protein